MTITLNERRALQGWRLIVPKQDPGEAAGTERKFRIGKNEKYLNGISENMGDCNERWVRISLVRFAEFTRIVSLNFVTKFSSLEFHCHE